MFVRSNYQRRRFLAAALALAFVLLNTLPVKAGSQYTEAWQAKEYRAVKLILPNPSGYIDPISGPAGRLNTRIFYDDTIPNYETQWICLGVSKWEVNFSKDGQTLTEYWGADNDTDHWRNYYPTGPIKSPGSNGQPRYLKAQFSNVDSCDNTKGYWIEATWSYLLCVVTGDQLSNCNNTITGIGPDRYMLYNIGQYALLGEIGGQTKEGNGTLAADYLYPFNIKSEPIKWNVVGATN